MTEMTREEIIWMAREAGGVDIESNGYTSWVGTQTTEFLERFAALIASRVAAAAKAEEREACAMVCEAIGQHNIINQCAAAIRERSANARARGETK